MMQGDHRTVTIHNLALRTFCLKPRACMPMTGTATAQTPMVVQVHSKGASEQKLYNSFIPYRKPVQLWEVFLSVNIIAKYTSHLHASTVDSERIGLSGFIIMPSCTWWFLLSVARTAYTSISSSVYCALLIKWDFIADRRRVQRWSRTFLSAAQILRKFCIMQSETAYAWTWWHWQNRCPSREAIAKPDKVILVFSLHILTIAILGIPQLNSKVCQTGRVLSASERKFVILSTEATSLLLLYPQELTFHTIRNSN